MAVARRTQSRVSVSEPIWLTFTRMALAMPLSMPSARIFGLVTKRSSPTIWILLPSRSVRCFQPYQSPSAKPSSTERMGNFVQRSAMKSTMPLASTFRPSPVMS